jgi:hypothetical protein
MAIGIPYAFGDDMRFALAAILGAHGLAHLVGFVSSWRLATLPELPYKTTTFAGRFDLGDAGIRVVGVLWLLVAVAFLGSAMAVAAEAHWAPRLTLVVVVASAILCAAGWPDSHIGLAVNVALAGLVLIGAHLQLIAVP